jgi:hypothetical protein
MGNCCASPEEKKGPIRSRFSLDHAPTDLPKTAIFNETYTFHLSGYKHIQERNINLLGLLSFHNTRFLSELYEYLPQYHLKTNRIDHKIRHPKKDVLHSIIYEEDKNTSLGTIWKKEEYGNTWTQYGMRTADHTYDPLLKHILQKLVIVDLLIYDSGPYLRNSVYIKARDTQGNIHTIFPYSTSNGIDHSYKLDLYVNETMYLDQLDDLRKELRESLYKGSRGFKYPVENIIIKKEPITTIKTEPKTGPKSKAKLTKQDVPTEKKVKTESKSHDEVGSSEETQDNGKAESGTEPETEASAEVEEEVEEVEEEVREEEAIEIDTEQTDDDTEDESEKEDRAKRSVVDIASLFDN